MIRGGSWNDDPVRARSAYRNRNDPDNRNDNLGFRVLLPAPARALRESPSMLRAVDGPRLPEPARLRAWGHVSGFGRCVPPRLPARPFRTRGGRSGRAPPVRRARGLFEHLVDPDRLAAAALEFVRGKRRRPDVAAFLFNRDAVLSDLGLRLSDGTWAPDGFQLVAVHDPKPRLIARASVRDRVVHAALARLLEPIVLRTVMPDSFACRPGFGTHRARLRLRALVRRHRFVVHLDVRAYFASIDLDILRGLLCARIADGPFLDVLDRLLVAGAGLHDRPGARGFLDLDPIWPPPGGGLPVGAVTSQLLATHLYLDALDHFVKRSLKVPGWVRYVDDLFLFGDARSDLHTWRAEVGAWLAQERRLRLKHPHARVLATAGHLDALGVRIHRGGWSPMPAALRRFAGQTWEMGETPGAMEASVEARVASFAGHLVGR